MRSCILSKFYIKPQRRVYFAYVFHVVSYRNSTSNHNKWLLYIDSLTLYLIEILHQTTTVCHAHRSAPRLYLIEILHQTTTKRVANSLDLALYLIEILHQTTTLSHLGNLHVELYLIEILHQTTTRTRNIQLDDSVVSYRNSTSNHNASIANTTTEVVVSYRNSTSNHNYPYHAFFVVSVVSYRNSTSNHNL